MRKISFGVLSTDSGWSLAACRIAIHASVLWSLELTSSPRIIAATFREKVPESYNPIGVLAFFGPKLPPEIFFTSLYWVAFVSTWFALIGIFSRVSMLVSAAAVITLVPVLESFNVYGWSHGFNLILLTQLAFCFADAGQTLSIDAVLRNLRRNPPVSRTPSASVTATRAPVYLAQLSVGLMFANAAYWKLYNSGLDWALSDNMRNVILVQYPLMGLDLPGYLRTVVNNEYLYKGLAFGNLVSQAFPMFACIVVRWPFLRLVFGSFFVFEEMGLCTVMGLCDFHWLPLSVVFVDWDYFVNFFRDREGSRRLARVMSLVETRTDDRSVALAQGRYANIAFFAFGASFIAYYVLVAFQPFLKGRDLHFRLKTYPFSAFSMYSGIMAEAPFDIHRPYYRLGVRVALVGGEQDDAERIAKLNKQLTRKFYSLAGLNNLKDITVSLQGIRTTLLAWDASLRFARIDLLRTIFEFPAYPAPAELQVVDQGLIGSITHDGEILAAAATVGFDPAKNSRHVDINVSATGRFTVDGLQSIRNFHEGPAGLSASSADGRRHYFDPEGRLGLHSFIFDVRTDGQPAPMRFQSMYLNVE